MIYRDIDFFEQYKIKTNEKKSQKKYIYTIAIILGITIFSTLIYNIISIKLLNKEIVKIDEALNDEYIIKKINEAEEINEKLNILNEYNTGVSKISKDLNSRNIITEDILTKINSTIPKEVSFSNISITGSTISISANSKTRTAIAELQYNLKKLDIIGDVFIGGISGDGSTEKFSFELKCTVVGE